MLEAPEHRARRYGHRTVLVGAAAVVALVASACGASSNKSSSEKSPTGKPVAGNTLTVAFGAPPNSLNPATISLAFSTYTQIAYDALITQAADGSLKPALATSWKYVGTGNSQLDLTLRAGVTFSDGSPLTAAAVKGSLDFVRTQPGPQTALLGAIASIGVTGPLTLSIKLAAPNPLLPEMLSQSFGVGQIISPAGVAKAAGLTVASPSAGAGPYVFDGSASVAGDHYVYTARAGYYDPSRQHYKKIIIRVIPDPQAELNALRTGQVDAIAGGNPSIASQVSSAGLRVLSVKNGWLGLDLFDRHGTVNKPLGDVRVRQAINYAIDRNAVTKALTGSYGSPTTQTVLKDQDGYSAAAAAQYAYDPAKAKSLMTAAGYPNGFTFSAVSSIYAGIDTMAQAVAGQLAKVGIKMKVTTVTDQGSYIGDITSKKFGAAAIPFGGLPIWAQGAELFLPQAFIFNPFGTADPGLSSLYAQAAGLGDDASRGPIDVKIENYLVDNAWFAPVTVTPFFYYARSNLGGLAASVREPFANPVDWYNTK
jgi:ABC-type transport system substrate-binding protein